MKNKQYLPMYGVGPVYVAVILALTVAEIVLTAVGYIPTARVEFIRIPLRIIGILMIVLGVWFWWSAVFRSRVDDHIKNNSLVTTGVYARVRNSIYSAFLLACTGGCCWQITCGYCSCRWCFGFT